MSNQPPRHNWAEERLSALNWKMWLKIGHQWMLLVLHWDKDFNGIINGASLRIRQMKSLKATKMLMITILRLSIMIVYRRRIFRSWGIKQTMKKIKGWRRRGCAVNMLKCSVNAWTGKTYPKIFWFLRCQKTKLAYSSVLSWKWNKLKGTNYQSLKMLNWFSQEFSRH